MNLNQFDMYRGTPLEQTPSKISQDAKVTVQECVTEFLLFITSEASEICANAKRTTI